MTSDQSAAILAEVERTLKGMFAEGIVIDVTGDDVAGVYETKAAMTNYKQLAKGYRKLAKKARKAARK